MKNIVIHGKNYIPILEFIKITKMARITIKRYLSSGLIKGIVIGRKYWIDEEDFQKFLN